MTENQIPLTFYAETAALPCAGCGSKGKAFRARIVIRDEDNDSLSTFPLATIADAYGQTENEAVDRALGKFASAMLAFCKDQTA